MLVTLNEVLPAAREAHYAVPAFDVCEDVMVRTVLEVAEEKRSPVILMCLEPELQGSGMAYLPGLIKTVAQYHTVPVVLHLDHATNFDLVAACVDNGFTSVMFDGSRLPFDENVAISRRVAELAHPRGIAVEAELGLVGGQTLDDTQTTETVLTEVDDVVRFVERTGVDALAISIGTGHGVYRRLPTLNIGRLREIDAVSPVPLVLHGSSGTPLDQVQDAIRNGITKLNTYADLRCAMAEGLRKAVAAFTRPDPLPHEMFGPVKESLRAVIAARIDLALSAGRVPGSPPVPRLPEGEGSYQG